MVSKTVRVKMKLLKFIIVLIFTVTLHLYAQYDVKVEQDGNNNEILVNQSGLFNKINVLQRTDNSRSVINQDGTGNVIAQINENSDSGAITKQKVVQDGDFNYASQVSLKGTGWGEQRIHQTGSYNNATQLRLGDVSSAIITQAGNNNNASENLWIHAENATAKIIQDGDYNYSRIDIDGSQALADYNAALIETHGNSNGCECSPVRINLVGDNHSAKILQGTKGDIDNNNAVIRLVGIYSNADTGNKATISQEYGNGNEAQITSIGMQNGSNTENGLLIQQQGSNNYGDLQVYGMGLGGSIIQIGDNMSVRVIRTN